jgi:hypothetical protein
MVEVTVAPKSGAGPVTLVALGWANNQFGGKNLKAKNASMEKAGLFKKKVTRDRNLATGTLEEVI